MGFNVEGFLSADWQPRQTEVPVPGLKDFFDKKDKAVWIVKTLTGIEVAQAKHAKERNARLSANIDAISEVLAAGNSKKVKENLISLFGNVDAEADTAWRTELLILGSVEPRVDYPFAAMLHKTKPEEYYKLTNEIIRLCGVGHEPGKSPPSGATKKSKQR